MKIINFTRIKQMKQLIFAAILSVGMHSCSYGQRDVNLPMYKVEVVMEAAKRFYVDTINKDKLAEYAIIGMLEKLDPHSTYMTPEEVKETDESLQGNFEGIGIQFNMLTDTLNVIQVISGGPSEKVGIQAGDRIIEVNDTLIAGVKMPNKAVISRLKGPKGTVVNVKVLRRNNSGLLSFNITRDKIPMHSLNAYYMLDNRTGYIKLDRFAATSYDEFKDAVTKLQAQGMKNLIFDLQQNGGGFLEAAIKIANEFLHRGQLIVYTEGEHQKRADAKADYNGSLEDGRLILLVDEYSASASEIVSGAVQDWDRGLIVGRRTFGKGLVQRPIPLPDGSLIRLTTARYYTPTGRSIQKPYENGNPDSYNKDLIDRYNRGEMLSADSIHFPDSLKYNTLIEKRTVYGGGGIMPDYFVPINNDSTHWYYLGTRTSLFRELNGKNITYKYINRLLDDNRKIYAKQYTNFNTFNRNFTVTDKMIADALAIYKQEKAVELEQEDYQLTAEELTDLEKVKPVLQFLIKSYIIREVLDESNYYHFLNESDVSFNAALKKAIQLINSPDEYDKLLKKK
jgi:carboxyl-terminal processing protease